MEGIYNKILKNSRLSLLLLCMGLFGNTMVLKAQLDTSDFNFYVQYIVDNANIASSDTVYFHEIIIELYDTNDVSKINVEVGTLNGYSDILAYSFDFDKLNLLPANFYYSREKGQVKLVVGKRTNSQYFYQISLTDGNGNNTLEKRWNNLNSN